MPATPRSAPQKAHRDREGRRV